MMLESCLQGWRSCAIVIVCLSATHEHSTHGHEVTSRSV